MAAIGVFLPPIEDGAAFAACLRQGSDDPAAALEGYERLCLPRVTRLQQMSRANKLRFHMRDGPEQEARRRMGQGG
jgi:salicylate hydroxylase